MKTLLIGANGKIGRLFCRHAAARGLPLRAMIRDPRQAAFFETLDVETVTADLEGDFEAALEGCERLIFTAGSGPHTGADKTLLIDLYGAMRSIRAAEASGIEQFVMISALRAEDPRSAPEKLRPYMAAKLAADEILMHSSLAYTLLRPGRLSDEPATGRIQVPESGHRDPITITREDVALCLLEVLGQTWARGRTINLVNGSEPIAGLSRLLQGVSALSSS